MKKDDIDYDALKNIPPDVGRRGFLGALKSVGVIAALGAADLVKMSEPAEAGLASNSFQTLQNLNPILAQMTTAVTSITLLSAMTTVQVLTSLRAVNTSTAPVTLTLTRLHPNTTTALTELVVNVPASAGTSTTIAPLDVLAQIPGLTTGADGNPCLEIASSDNLQLSESGLTTAYVVNVFGDSSY